MCHIFLIWTILEARAEICQKKVHFLEELKTPKFHTEITWPLACCARAWLSFGSRRHPTTLKCLGSYYDRRRKARYSIALAGTAVGFKIRGGSCNMHGSSVIFSVKKKNGGGCFGARATKTGPKTSPNCDFTGKTWYLNRLLAIKMERFHIVLVLYRKTMGEGLGHVPPKQPPPLRFSSPDWGWVCSCF